MMKTPLNPWGSRRAFAFGLTLSTHLLLVSLPLAAATNTPYLAESWVTDVLHPGAWVTNALGHVCWRGSVHTARVQSSDARLTGQRLILLNGAYNADGTATVQGPCYQQVGVWDAAGTNFTPAAGLWDISCRGTMQADNRLQLRLVGHGLGGSIDGLRFEEDLTRAAGPLFDPAVSYYHIGTIKPPPLNTNVMLDNFNGPPMCWANYGAGSYSITRSNGQLVVWGHWPGVITRSIVDSYALGGPEGCTGATVADGQTLETRVELVNLNFSATAAIIGLGTTSGFYALWKGHNFLVLYKWSSSLPWGPIIVFSYKAVQAPDTNVILSLALTKTNANVVLTARVLAKDSGVVLGSCSAVDTPNADPALTTAELTALSGINLAVAPDLAAAPFVTGWGFVGLFQYTDGGEPPAQAIFDNLKLRMYEIPEFSLERAVRLCWPTPAGTPYEVEAAPTVLGPWLQVQDLPAPGTQQVTVPADEASMFFRLQQAP